VKGLFRSKCYFRRELFIWKLWLHDRGQYRALREDDEPECEGAVLFRTTQKNVLTVTQTKLT
jgi:hypothetical protein